jgi:hypothetical protein
MEHERFLLTFIALLLVFNFLVNAFYFDVIKMCGKMSI